MRAIVGGVPSFSIAANSKRQTAKLQKNLRTVTGLNPSALIRVIRGEIVVISLALSFGFWIYNIAGNS
jgi:hypothetical protein